MALKVAHVMNQFYAGIGAEAHADMPLEVRPGPLGAGAQIQRLLGADGLVTATLIVGDNWAHVDPAAAVERVVGALADIAPDAVVLGPAFGSGRYGITCGRIAAAVTARLGLRAVVTAMHVENPGVEMFRREVVIIPTTVSASGMGKALDAMTRLLLRLARGERLGAPDVDGYIPRGVKRNVFHDTPAAERAVAMLIDKVESRPFATEIVLPRFSHIAPPPRVAQVAGATLAIVTTGGVVPRGNPDRMESRRASKWARYSLAGLRTADAAQWESIHGGFDNHFLNEDPNRVLPLDVLREMEGHEFRRLFPDVISTVGGMMAIETSEAFGRQIAQTLVSEGVDGVLLAVT
jgi:glycine reductase